MEGIILLFVGIVLIVQAVTLYKVETIQARLDIIQDDNESSKHRKTKSYDEETQILEKFGEY